MVTHDVDLDRLGDPPGIVHGVEGLAEGLDLVLVVIRLVQMLPHANIVQLAPRSEVVNSDISLIPEEQFELSQVGLQHDLPQVLPHKHHARRPALLEAILSVE